MPGTKGRSDLSPPRSQSPAGQEGIWIHSPLFSISIYTAAHAAQKETARKVDVSDVKATPVRALLLCISNTHYLLSTHTTFFDMFFGFPHLAGRFAALDA